MVIFFVELVFLFWLREGSDNRFGVWYELNCFVFLYLVEVGDGIDVLVDGKIYDIKLSFESLNCCWIFKIGVYIVIKSFGCSMVKG